MIHLRALGVVAILLALLAIPLSMYWDFLTRGMSPPPSTQIVTDMEKNGIPDFTLPDVNGKPVTLSMITDKRIVVVNFWASWCGPCVKEFPSLKRLVEKMDGKLVVLAISNDHEKADLDSFLKSFGPSPHDFIVLWDKDKKVSDLYGTEVLPESYIVGPNRKLIRKVAGVDDWSAPHALEFFQELVSRL
jgi:cytochrome c biogenesis protein CcmG, thiol:disulfide interchange protein DsbE